MAQGSLDPDELEAAGGDPDGVAIAAGQAPQATDAPSPMSDPGAIAPTTPMAPAPVVQPPQPAQPQWAPAAGVAYQHALSKGATMAEAMAAADTAQKATQANQASAADLQAAQMPAAGPVSLDETAMTGGTGKVQDPSGYLVIKDRQGIPRRVDTAQLSPEKKAELLDLKAKQDAAGAPSGPSAPAIPAAPGGLAGGQAELRAMQRQNTEQTNAELKAVDTVSAAQGDAALKQADVDKKISDEVFKVKAGNQFYQNWLQEAHLNTQATIERQKKETWSKVESYQQKQAAFAFNPDRFVDSMSTGSKVMTVISMMLGGMAQAFTHGGNIGADLLRQHIEDDARSQQLEYNKLKDNTEGAQSDYAHFMQQGLNEDQSLAASISAGNARSAMMVDVIGAKYGGEQAKARAMAIKAGLDMSSVQAKNTIEQHAAVQGLSIARDKNSLAEFDINKQMQERGQDIEMAKVNATTRATALKDNEALTVTGVGLARTPEAAKKANEMVADQRDLNASFQSLDKLLSDHPIKGRLYGLTGEDRLKAEQDASIIKAKLMETYGIKRFTEAEQSYLDQLVPKPGEADWMGKRAGAIAKLKEMAEQHYNNNMKQLMREGSNWRISYDEKPIEGGK